MTTYQVQGPDGQVHDFEGPANAKPEEVLAAAQAQFGQNQPAPQSADEQAFAAGHASGAGESALTAGIGQAAQQGTMGLQNYINAGARYVGQRLTGVQKPDDFHTDLSYSRGKSQGEIEAHPVAGTVGGVAGTVMGGGAAGAVLKGSRFARAMAPVAGEKVANVAKSAAAGFGIGGTNALAEGQPAPQALQTAAITSVAAPVGQKVLTYSLSKLQPAGAKAMQTLASSIGESPKVLQDAYDSFLKLTGNIPSMAQLVGLQSQGKLRDLARANPTIAASAIKAANFGNAPLHEQLAATQNATMPQSAAGITALRDTETDANMNIPHPQTGVPLKDTLVNDPHGVLLAPHVELALRPNSQLNSRLGQGGVMGSELMDRITSNQATIGDVDQVRRALRDVQSSLMSPSVGAQHAKDPIMAREFGDMANKVEGLGVRADKDYGHVLANYRNASNYAEGFTHGLKGNSILDVPDGDTRLASAFKTAHGNAGYEHGNALYTAQQALQGVAPGSVKTAEGGMGAGHVAQATMAASSGGISAVYHGMKALPVIGDRVPEKVQKIIAKQLFDPKTTQQGINNLRRAGIEDKDIRSLGTVMGGVAAQNIASYLSPAPTQ